MFLTEKSDRMLELLAKATCQEFRDKTEITGEGGGPVKIHAVRYPIRIEDKDLWAKTFQSAISPVCDEDDESDLYFGRRND